MQESSPRVAVDVRSPAPPRRRFLLPPLSLDGGGDADDGVFRGGG